MNINKYICTGRLTKDPELRALPNGPSVCELRVAVDGMGRNQQVGYINVSVFGNGGEATARHLSKGWLVSCVARLPSTGSHHDRARVRLVISVRLRGSRRRAASCCQPRPVPHAADPARRSPEAAATELLLSGPPAAGYYRVAVKREHDGTAWSAAVRPRRAT